MSKEKEHEVSETLKEEELIFEDTSRYKGGVINNKANGYGKLWLANGDYY